MSTLLLNADSQPLSLMPLSTMSWQESIKQVFAERCYVVKEYDDWVVNSPSISIKVPSIIQLTQYIKPPAKVPLTRRNIWLRDAGSCQYCGVSLPMAHMTLDHVLPRSKGGRSSWQNLVTSCQRCNYSKGAKTNIKPRRSPVEPSRWQIQPYAKQRHITIPDPAWQDFLLWPAEYLSIKSP